MASRTASIYNSRIKLRKDITFARRKSRNVTERLCLCSSRRCCANYKPQHWPSPVNTSASWFARNSHDHPPASNFRGHILGFQECPSLAHGAGWSMPGQRRFHHSAKNTKTRMCCSSPTPLLNTMEDPKERMSMVERGRYAMRSGLCGKRHRRPTRTSMQCAMTLYV